MKTKFIHYSENSRSKIFVIGIAIEKSIFEDGVLSSKDQVMLLNYQYQIPLAARLDDVFSILEDKSKTKESHFPELCDLRKDQNRKNENNIIQNLLP
jgi:hypothetical protein